MNEYYEPARKLDAQFVPELAEVWEDDYLVLVTGDFAAASECYNDCDPTKRRMMRAQYVRIREV